MEPAEQGRRVVRPGLLYPQESYRIKGACLAVHQALGCGFLEKVYENALVHELVKAGFEVGQQVPLKVRYDRQVVGDFFIDLLVDGKFILEVKATSTDHPVHKAQLINYLKAADFPLGFLVNFGQESLSFERVVLTKGR